MLFIIPITVFIVFAINPNHYYSIINYLLHILVIFVQGHNARLIICKL